MRLADAAAPRGHALPGEEGQDSAGVAGLIAIIEVIGRRIIEIDRLLDEAQPEIAGVKAEIPDGVAGNRSDMVQSRHLILQSS